MLLVQKVAFALLAVLEGCRLTAYQDPGGVWTIGFGHTGPDVHEGLTISADQAQALFEQDQAHLLTMVATVQSAAAAAALVSFGYNCGAGSLAKVLAGTDTIENPKYTHDMHGNVLSFLVRRRRLEAVLMEI